MGELTEKLLSDAMTGIRTDAGGRRYFVQRRLEFRTLELLAQEILDPTLPGRGESLYPLDWSKEPSHSEIRSYAFEASERFLLFWYRVLDVAMARALAGRDREIYRQNFLKPSTYLDIGIPEESRFSSVHPGLHEKILREYQESGTKNIIHNIYYLSDYLSGITDDVIDELRPYQSLWDLKKNRRILIRELDDAHRRLREPLDSPVGNGRLVPAHRIALYLREAILERIGEIISKNEIRLIENDRIRNMVYRIRGGVENLTGNEIQEILENPSSLSLSRSILRLQTLMTLADRLHQKARSAASQLSLILKAELRILKLNYLHRKYDFVVEPRGLHEQIRRYTEIFAERFRSLNLDGKHDAMKLSVMGMYASLHHYRNVLKDLMITETITNQSLHPVEKSLFDHWPVSLTQESPEWNDSGEQWEQAGRFFRIVAGLKQADDDLTSYHKTYSANPDTQTENSDEISHEDPARVTTKYYNHPFKSPGDLHPGNPYDEPEIIEHARRTLYRRLRPVRMTATAYSTIADDRHGAMSLNPVLRLWKDRIRPRERNLPDLATYELNTRQTADCLLELTKLVDTGLEDRLLERRGVVKEQRGDEGIFNMKIFLLPGSVFPIREISRTDFPDFRSKVIGESRNPMELGVPTSVDSILTGAWYQKQNHSLYHTVGADNGSLIETIWKSGRFPGPPAFFFALGQFVHDTLPDNLAYYRAGEKTFRQCVEEYYLEEDRIRKNRGEKTGRRKADNSRPAIRFMFAVQYSYIILEALTGSPQTSLRHAPSEQWLSKHLGLPIHGKSDLTTMKRIREKAREIIHQ